MQTVPGCSKLRKSLVNVSLTFQTLISEIREYFCWKKNLKSFCIAKASLIYFNKNISVFGYKVVNTERVDLLKSSLS